MGLHRSAPLSPELAARYSCLPGAAVLLEELAPSLGDLVQGPSYGAARRLAAARLRGTLAPEVPIAEMGDASPSDRVASFLYAHAVASLPTLLPFGRRWCRDEAARLGRALRERDLAEEDLLAVASELGVEPRVDGASSLSLRGYELTLPAYLHLASAVRDPRFALVHQPLEAGRIRLAAPDLGRLLEEGVRRWLESTLPDPLTPEAFEALREREAPLLAELSRHAGGTGREGFGPLRPELFPPCVQGFARRLAAGENVPHLGRFALAAFLYRTGAELDAIVEYYRQAPNFDERITRYQVSQITHHDGGEGYTPPECATLIAAGLCRREEDSSPSHLCSDPGRLRHPLSYYRQRYRSSSPAAASAPATSPGPGTPP